MKYLLALGLLFGSSLAEAEVVHASGNGFEVRETVSLGVPAHRAYEAFRNLPGWWDPEHTYSGHSANLSLELRPGGCFCERIPKTGGGIEHMRVTFVEPGKHVTLTGALGPLLYEATMGVMDVQITRISGGSRLTLDYKVAGFANGGADKLAGAVDGVLTNQMSRYRAYATSLAHN